MWFYNSGTAEHLAHGHAVEPAVYGLYFLGSEVNVGGADVFLHHGLADIARSRVWHQGVRFGSRDLSNVRPNLVVITISLTFYQRARRRHGSCPYIRGRQATRPDFQGFLLPLSLDYLCSLVAAAKLQTHSHGIVTLFSARHSKISEKEFSRMRYLNMSRCSLLLLALGRGGSMPLMRLRRISGVYRALRAQLIAGCARSVFRAALGVYRHRACRRQCI